MDTQEGISKDLSQLYKNINDVYLVSKAGESCFDKFRAEVSEVEESQAKF